MDVEDPVNITATTITHTAEGLSTESILFISMTCFAIIFICGGNALVILVFTRTPDLHVKSRASIISLATADFGIGLHISSLIVMEVAPEVLQSFDFCRIPISFAIGIFLVSISNLTGGYLNIIQNGKVQSVSVLACSWYTP